MIGLMGRSSKVALIAGALFLTSCAPSSQAPSTPRTEFNIGWSIYAGWMPWPYAQQAGIVKKWADKYGIKINIVQVNDYVESVNQYTAGKFDGVTRVVPRIVGRITLGKENVEAVLVGMPREELHRQGSTIQQLTRLVDGELPGSRHGEGPQLVIGSGLARKLNLEVGAVLPPIFRSGSGGGEKTPRVTGIFQSDISLWQSRMILTTFESAADIFGQQELATDLLVFCRRGQPEAIRLRILQSIPGPSTERATSLQPSVTSRADLESLLPAGLGHREGVFNLLFVVAFAVGILVILVTSGFGLSGRRREIGILKATGWQTDEILVRSLAESVLLGLASDGVHSNGYSLVRKIVEVSGLGWDDDCPWGEGTLGAALLRPTRLYVKQALAAVRAGGVHALAHITGGGLTENLPRVLNEGQGAEIDLDSWDLPPVFNWLAETGGLAEAEMLKTFNSGIGMVLVVEADRASEIIKVLIEAGEQVHALGHVTEGAGVTYRGALA